MPSYTAGTAYLRIAPSMTGFHTSLHNELRSVRPEPVLDVRINPIWRGANIPRISDQTVNIRADIDRRSFADALNGVAMLSRSLATLAIPAALAAGVPILGALAGAAVASAGALLLIPAAGIAAGLAIGALKIGMSGFGDAMKALGDPAKFAEAIGKLSPAARAAAIEIQALAPAWTALRMDVQDALFRNMAGTIATLAGQYMPLLRTSLVSMATSLNDGATQIGVFMARAQSVRDVRTIFENSNVAMRAMSTIGVDLVSILKDIAVVGSGFLPGLATGWAAAASRASDYVNNLRETGQLQVIIQNGLTALSQLGQLFSNVGTIIGTVWRAAGESGGSMLATMIAVTGAAGDFLNTANGYGALVAVFTTLRGVVAALIPGLLAFAGSIATGIQILGPALPPIAAAFSAVLTAVSPLIPVLAQVAGILAGAFAQAVTILAPLLSVIATTIGSVLLAAMRALDPVLAVLLELFRQLVPPLSLLAQTIGNALVSAIRVLAPSLPPLAEQFSRIVMAVVPLIEPLVRVASTILNALLPVVPMLVGAFLRLIEQALMPLLPPLVRLVEALLPGVVAAIQVAVPVIGFLVNAFVSVVTTIYSMLVPAIERVAAIIEWLNGFWRSASATVSTTWADISSFISTAWNGTIKPTFDALVGFIRTVLEVAFNVLWTTVRIAIGAIGAIIMVTWNTIIKPVWDALVAFVNTVLAPLFVWLQVNIIEPVWRAIQAAINAAWTFIRDNIWNPIVTFVRTLLAPVFEAFGQTSNTVWEGVRAGINSAWVFIRDNIWNPLVGFITRTIPDAFATGTRIIGDLWSGIKKTMRDPVQAVIDVVYNKGIVASWNTIADFIGLTNQKLAPFNLPQYAKGGPVTRPTVGLIGEAGPEYVLSAPAVRNMGGMSAVDAMHRQALDRQTFRALNSGRLVEGADHEGAGYSTVGFGGVRPNVAKAGHYLRQKFGIGSVGGVGARKNASDHPAGLALDFMTRGENGTQLANYVIANKGHLGVTYAIWRQQINNGSGWRRMEDRGNPTANHMDHVHVSFNGGIGGGAVGNTGGLEGGGAPAFDPIGYVLGVMGDLGGMLGRIPGAGMFGDLVRGFGGKAFNAVKDFAISKVMGWVQSIGSSIIGGIGSLLGITGGGGSARAAVQGVAKVYGWDSGANWAALDRLIAKESSWNPNAQNPTSTAYGLFQFLNGTWGSTGVAKTSDPGRQAEAGLRYIQSRYGNPVAALDFHNRNNWYDLGGIASGTGLMMKQVLTPERVLSSRQTAAFDSLVASITGRQYGTRLTSSTADGGAGAGRGGPFIGTLVVPVPDGSSVNETIDTVMTRARHEVSSGRYSRPGG